MEREAFAVQQASITYGALLWRGPCGRDLVALRTVDAGAPLSLPQPNTCCRQKWEGNASPFKS